ncbi:probable inactive receptor kinase At1g48480 [Cynara cardunculus var. scolymus]|uniref:Leucine-rich repeat-containing N-terminal, type 2 n=1 Tax=Cynara cardunculus var. scolymus TaxID=59895 RepID=A0A103Y8F9_CYNCS|nr:probable inactive receptor kinase At1g48480 [Cynara cardunculus var. scolymus]KVI04437.1 Leucine-rich repeat-containing N-terminal, type 2 [Cynara cardunculus var. scolymus]
MVIHSVTAIMLLVSFHILLLLPDGIMTDLTSDRAALLSLRSAVGGRTLFWTTTQQNPCNWAGVQCDNTINHVTALHLPGVSLSGQLPVGIFGNLTQLRTLSLRFNALSGPLPSDLSSCVNLRNLYLQGNRFSGNFPEKIFSSLRDLVRLNLAGNNLSGEISTGFNNFTRLRTLYLENNQFYGSLPELKIPNLEQFNVSFNNLNGSVPKSLQSNPKESFVGNSLCGSPLDQSCPRKEDVPPAVSVDLTRNRKKKNRLSGGAIAGIVVGSVLGLVVVLLLLYILCRKRTTKKTSSIDIGAKKLADAEVLGEKPLTGSGMGSNGFSVAAAAAAAMTTSSTAGANTGGGGDATGNKKLVFFRNSSTIFDLEDLLRASAEVLGKGTFGTAYKAVLEAGMMVAVKRLKDVTVSESEFREKMESVGAMDHENLVPLRAYYYSKEEKLLVYDYMPMGSLSALLHGNKGGSRTPLNWEIRSSIALGTARGIDYLHSHGHDVSHGNIKSSNILLSKSYDARISDFGLAHLVGLPSTPNRVAGYRAPEVTDPRRVSQKADVYSFGVLLLELLTGKAPTHALLNEEGVDLPRWVQSTVKEEWTSEVFDLELLRYQNVEEEMVQLLQLAIDCAAQYPDNRPTMAEAMSRIEELRRVSLIKGGDGVSNPDPDRVHESD